MQNCIKKSLSVIFLVLLGSNTPFVSAAPSPLKGCRPNVIDIIENHPELKGLSYLFSEVTELKESVRAMPDMTFFAPSDAAFSRLTDAEFEELIAKKGLLTYILEFHITEQRITSAMAKEMDYAEMLNGRLTSLMTSGDDIFVDDSKLEVRDIEACNGVVHIIDKVIGS